MMRCRRAYHASSQPSAVYDDFGGAAGSDSVRPAGCGEPAQLLHERWRTTPARSFQLSPSKPTEDSAQTPSADICYKIRAYIFKRDDDHAPEFVRSTTCGPIKPQAKNAIWPKARVVRRSEATKISRSRTKTKARPLVNASSALLSAADLRGVGIVVHHSPDGIEHRSIDPFHHCNRIIEQAGLDGLPPQIFSTSALISSMERMGRPLPLTASSRSCRLGLMAMPRSLR